MRPDVELETRITEAELPGVLDPPPGSAREAEALARIDAAREDERERLRPEARAQARRRRHRYWRPRGLHVDV